MQEVRIRTSTIVIEYLFARLDVTIGPIVEHQVVVRVLILVPITVLVYLTETSVRCNVLHLLLAQVFTRLAYYLSAEELIPAALFSICLRLILVIVLQVIEGLSFPFFHILHVRATDQS